MVGSETSHLEQETNKNPGEKQLNQVLLTNLIQGGPESKNKPIGVLEFGQRCEPASERGEGGVRDLCGRQSPEASQTLTWPEGPGLGVADGAQLQRFRPAGLQEVARRFRCRGCYSTVCDLPLDCPGEGRGLEGEGTARTGGAGAEPGSDLAKRGRARAVTRTCFQLRT